MTEPRVVGSGDVIRRLDPDGEPLPGDLAIALAELAASRRRAARQRDRFEEHLEAARRIASQREVAFLRSQRELARIRNWPPYRLARSAAPLIRPVVATVGSARSWTARAVRELLELVGLGGRSAGHRLRASAADERRLAASIVSGLSAEPSPAPRPIDIVIDWRGNPERLGRVLEGLGRTTWPDRRIHVVGPGAQAGALGSTAIDHSVDVVTERDRLSAHVEILDRLSDGLVLLMDDELDPLEPGWLKRLVDGMDRTGAGAVGPRLVFGSRTGPRRGPPSMPADLRLAQRGTSVVLADGLPTAAGLGSGEDATAGTAAATSIVPALPRACLLIRPEALAAAGGLRPGDLEREPVDLFVRMRQAGWAAAYVGGSVVWDRSSVTDRVADLPVGESGNVRGACAAVFREAFLDGLAGAGVWGQRPLHVAIAMDAAGDMPQSAELEVAVQLRDAFIQLGLRCSVVEVRAQAPRWDPSITAAVCISPDVGRSRLPRHAVTVALVRDRVDEWLSDPGFEDHDLVLVANDGLMNAVEDRTSSPAEIVPVAASPKATAVSIIASLGRWGRAPKIAIHIGPPTRAVASSWGDTAFAQALQREFGRRGWAATVHVREERDLPSAIRADVSLHILGLGVPPVRTGQVSLLWVISHPDRVTAKLCEDYDAVFVASDRFGRDLAERITVPVWPLHQATDPARFHPDASGPRHELLFVGNSRGVRRPTLEALAGSVHDLAVYGGGWTPELLDQRYLRGTWIPNDGLRRHYSSAAIVLSDHWRDMRDEGFISNRVYDALACGAFVLSDRVIGIDEEFDGGVATYERAEDVGPIVDRFLARPEERRAIADRGRAAVLARHTFSHRVDAIIQVVDGILSGDEERHGRRATSVTGVAADAGPAA